MLIPLVICCFLDRLNSQIVKIYPKLMYVNCDKYLVFISVHLIALYLLLFYYPDCTSCLLNLKAMLRPFKKPQNFSGKTSNNYSATRDTVI